MGHVILIGDSIFDKSAYDAGCNDVVRELRVRLPVNWRATLRAVDGATVSGVAGPPDWPVDSPSSPGRPRLGRTGALTPPP